MAEPHRNQIEWSVKTIAMSFVASVAGLLIAVALKQMGVWPRWDYSELLFGGVCGATAVYSLHRRQPLLVVFVFVPVMAAVLLLVTILFDVYVMGHPIEL